MKSDRRNLRRRSTKRSLLLLICYKGGVCLCLTYGTILVVIFYLRSLTTSNTTDPSLLLLERFLYGGGIYNNDTTAIQDTLQPYDSINTDLDKGNETLVANAFDAMGRSGFIADPTSMRRHQLFSSHHNTSLTTTIYNETTTWAVEVCDIPPGLGEEGPQGAQGLWKIRQSMPSQSSLPSLPRILCLVYTHSKRHDTALRAIVDTWGVECDGFLALSNQTDESLGAVHVAHPGPESYKNMWQKVRYGWSYVHQHYLNDFDWFHIGGDDHYVIVSNLKKLAMTLTKENPEDHPIYMGSSMVDHKVRDRYCGGGAGYTLNRAALSVLAGMLPTCFANSTTSEEDRCVGRCLKYNKMYRQLEHLNHSDKKDGGGILCRNTNDAWDEQRYHALDVQFHSAYHKNKKVPWDTRALKRKHNITSTQVGLKQISNTSISFHLTSAMIESRHADRGMRRYHALLYGACGPQMDRQMEIVASYNSSYLWQQLGPTYRENRQVWSDLRDKCAEVILSRDQRMTGGIARQYCSQAARRRKMQRQEQFIQME